MALRCSCGADYDSFRTGLSFDSVRRMLWNVTYPDGHKLAGRYRSKSRHAVLGYWRELKLMFWWSIHGGCDDAFR